MRAAFWQITKILKNKNFNYSQVRSVQKIVLNKSVALDEKTLTGRFLIYMKNYPYQEHKIQKDDDEIVNILRNRDLKKLMKMDTERFKIAFGLLENFHYFDKLEMKILTILDTDSYRRLNDLKPKEILDFLHIFMRIMPNQIVNFKFYKGAVKHLLFELNCLSKEELIQTIFFIGLQKKFAKDIIGRCLCYLNDTYINNLTTEEICIICNSTYKARLRIKNSVFLDKILKYINDNLYLFKDPALFVTLLKTIRHNRYQNEDLLSTISCTVFFNKTLSYYSFAALCHILAAYSDYCYYDANLIRTCADRCIELLKNTHNISKQAHLLEQPRLKDIKRLLWCLSNLNYKHLEKEDIKNVIVPIIFKYIENGHLGIEDSSSLVEITLYLWMLNYRAYELIPYALSSENVQYIKALKSPIRDRFNLLLSCIYFEDRSLFKELNLYPDNNIEYNQSFQLEKRPLLQKIIDNLEKIAPQHSIDKLELNCQVPGLKIVGITGYQKKIYKAVNIEILDEYTTLKNVEETPNGYMELKLRILDKSEEGLIVIHSEEVDSLSDSELQELLLDELELVC